jgi:hypothetical protein
MMAVLGVMLCGAMSMALLMMMAIPMLCPRQAGINPVSHGE